MKVKFTKAFAGKKKGSVMDVDPSLASQLVRVDKVATFVEEKEVNLDKAKKEEILQKATESALIEKEEAYYEEVKAEVIAEIEADKNAEYLAEIKRRIVEKLSVEDESEPK